ncbi:MAG: transposase [bacterium]|nr:transposase [bacterium]
MGIKKFNENEIEILRNNKYTYRVSENSIKFTVEFKELMFKRLNDGFSASTILEDCGYDLSILGKERPKGIACHIREEYKVNGSFHAGRKMSSLQDDLENGNVSPSKALIKMQAEIIYLRQQVEFLKKILKEEK